MTSIMYDSIVFLFFYLLGQDTHVLFGAANIIESFVGEISQFNVYDHVLTGMEIKSLGNLSKCNTAFGNILAWSQVPLQTHGNVHIRNNSRCMGMYSFTYIHIHCFSRIILTRHRLSFYEQ